MNPNSDKPIDPQQPPVEGAPTLPVSPPLVQEDFGDGQVAGATAFSTDNGLIDDAGMNIEPLDTAAYTSWSDLPVELTALPEDDLDVEATWKQGVQVPMSALKFQGPTGQPGVNVLRAIHEAPPFRPVVCIRGTNILIPFGAVDYRLFSQQDAATEQTVSAAMLALAKAIKAQGNPREIGNWNRVSDLLNVVTSYFNRSLPFTDLSVVKQFDIELVYSSLIAILSMPFFAFSAAGGYVKSLNRKQLQRVWRPAALYSTELQGALMQLYDEIRDLPILDEVMMDRLQSFARLHTSATKDGLWTAIIAQDVAIDDCLWTLTESQQFANGKYSYTKPSYQGIGMLKPYSFLQWLDLFLNAGSTGERYGTTFAFVATVTSYINDVLVPIATQIRTSFSIMLGTARQLEQKGSVKYRRCGEFLPVTGVTQTHLTFVYSEPGFDGIYKERFEYAPFSGDGEDTGGANQSMCSNLAEMLPNAPSGAQRVGSWSFKRPIGPWHTDKSWNLREVAGIGIFKYISYVGASLTGGVGITVPIYSATQVPLSVAGPTPLYDWVDAVYGDVYKDFNYGIITNNNPGLIVQGTYTIAYYGVINPTAPSRMLPVLDAWSGASMHNKIGEGVGGARQQVVLFYTADDDNPSANRCWVQQLAYTAEQLDLTRMWVIPGMVTGQQDLPVFCDTSYRQTEWEDFDITLMNNAYLALSKVMSIPMAKKNAEKQHQTT